MKEYTTFYCQTCGAKHLAYSIDSWPNGCCRILERNYDKEFDTWEIVKCRGELDETPPNKVKSKKVNKKGRKCSKCGEEGHNARTCTQGKRKCGNCGEYGHNKRTCPNK